MRDFDLEVYFAKWEFEAKYHLTASDAQSIGTRDLLEMASPDDREAFENAWLGYTETAGSPDLRATIAGTYDSLEAEHVHCFAGAEEGVYAAMRVLLTPADHAIVIVPNYQAAETIPLSICDVTGVALVEEEDWRLDLNALRKAVRPNTRLLSINFPNNPTGSIPSHEEYDELLDICRENKLYLFSDEVHRLLETDTSKRIPQAADVYEKAFSLNVTSKAYGLPGLRIGWLASQDTEALARIGRYKHYLSICNSAPSERLALIALKARERILARNRKIVRDNLKTLDAFFADFPLLFEWQRPDGGCTAFPKYNGADGVDAFCERLVQETGVFLLPGSVYRSELMDTPDDRFRIGFGRLGLDKGLDVIRRFLRTRRA